MGLTTTTKCGDDGWNLLAELVTPEGGAETVTRYVWGLDLSQSLQGAGGIGGLLLQDTGTKTRLYTYEANGNVGQLVDGSTGAVVAHYEYDPFGTTLTASGTAADANPFRFSTKYTDDETDLVYYGYRFYSPYLGRWLNRDFMGENGGVNLYLFNKNASMNFYDAFGLYPGAPGHGTMIPPSKSVYLINRLQEAADNQLDFEIREQLTRGIWGSLNADMTSKSRNLRRLHFIGQKGVISHSQTNKFVYTCKYGWIDHGHFFNNALGTYLSSYSALQVLSELNEIKQVITGSDSAYIPEDKISNALGRKFAQRMFWHDLPSLIVFGLKPSSFGQNITPASVFFNIAQEWEKLLKDAGAVKWGAVRGTTVEQLLKDETKSFSEYQKKNKYFSMLSGLTTGLAHTHRRVQPQWRCLCDGTVPKYEHLKF